MEPTSTPTQSPLTELQQMLANRANKSVEPQQQAQFVQQQQAAPQQQPAAEPARQQQQQAPQPQPDLQAELRELRATLSTLVSGFSQIQQQQAQQQQLPTQQAQVVPPTPKKFFDEDDFVDAMDNPEKLARLVHNAIEQASTPVVPQTNSDEIVQKVLQQVIPTITEQVRTNMTITAAVDSFYRDNPNFVVYRPLVQNELTILAQQYPNATLPDLLGKTKEAMKAKYQIDGGLPQQQQGASAFMPQQTANNAAATMAGGQKKVNPFAELIGHFKPINVPK